MKSMDRAAEQTMELSYFPGCSLHGTSVEYGESTRAVCSELGIGLREIEDWSCCGATSAHSVGGDLAIALPARNLAIAARSGLDVVVPCAACFSRLRAARLAASEGKLPEGVPAIEKVVDVLSLVSVLTSETVLASLSGKVARRLEALAAVAYYGCLLVRPVEVTGAADAEDPKDMDVLMRALGVDLRKWNSKTRCCGGGLALARGDIVEKLVLKILSDARRAGADAVVTACPMCLTNLESRQFEGQRSGAIKPGETVPVLYVTECVGLALGMQEVGGWLARHIIDPRPMLGSKGLV